MKRFRAWDKHMNKYVPFDTIGRIDFNDATYAYEQSTGLKDRAGKEMFEGDIVEWFAMGHDSRCGVRLGIIEYVPTVASFMAVIHNCFSHETARGTETLFKTEDKFKILGNIHENKKLLE